MMIASNDICVQSRQMLRDDANQLRVHVLAEGYQLMHSVKVLIKIVESAQKRSKEDLSSELLNTLVEAIARSSTRTPSTMLACRSLFELMLAVHIPRKRLFECMLAGGLDSVIADMDIDGRAASGAVSSGAHSFTASGESFIQTFKQELAEYFIRRCVCAREPSTAPITTSTKRIWCHSLLPSPLLLRTSTPNIPQPPPKCETLHAHAV